MLDRYYLYQFDSVGPLPERVVISDADPADIRADYGEWQEHWKLWETPIASRVTVH